MKVSVFSCKNFEKASLQKANQGQHDFVFIEQSLTAVTASLAKGSDAVCIFPNDDATATVLEKLKSAGVKYIANRAAGYDHIDLPKAAELGIRVGYVPEYSPYAIGEHAVALILALNRKLILADRKVKDFDFRLDDLIGFDLNGKTAGIIGLGKIGGVVAKILHGFGCRILGYDVEINQEYVEKYNVQYTTLEKLCKESDIISIHAPLNAQTKYMINKERLALMKNGVMIVNTGRGGLINTLDIIEALKEGKIGSLGLDVYEKEKGLFFYDHSKEVLKDDTFARLLTFKNVLITGHQAFLTENALENIADATVYNLTCFEKGEATRFELHPKEVNVAK